MDSVLITARLVGLLLASGVVSVWSSSSAQAAPNTVAAPGKALPTLYMIGDSTVRNGNGTGGRGEWGWGDQIAPFFDSTKIQVENDALGGRSSRTFLSEGRWDVVFQKLRPGDFVLMQFGHNDETSLDSKDRPRGTIASTGEETKEVLNQISGKVETVHTFGWYLRRFISDTESKGATMIVLSPIPRKSWNAQSGHLNRNAGNHAVLAREVAQAQRVFFVPLNDLVADRYDQLGQTQVAGFFPNDGTHTNLEGARLNASCVVAGLQALPGSPLAPYFAPPSSTTALSTAPPATEAAR